MSVLDPLSHVSLGKLRGKASYVDRPEAGTVAGGHILVERLDGGGTAQLEHDVRLYSLLAKARVPFTVYSLP